MIAFIVTSFCGGAAYLIRLKHGKDLQVEDLKKKNSDQTVDDLKDLIEELKKRIVDIEALQQNSASATMKQFHALELSIKDYQTQIVIVTEQMKNMEKNWTTSVKEIGEGWQRVSGKKF